MNVLDKIKINNKDIKNISIEIVETIVGAIIMAIAVSLFLLPNQISTGGFSGIATLFYYFLKIPMGTTILLLNIPLLIFSGYKLGKKFLLKTIVGITTYSIAIDILDKFTVVTEDRFLACIYGGIIVGLGTAIILNAHASTGRI